MSAISLMCFIYVWLCRWWLSVIFLVSFTLIFPHSAAIRYGTKVQSRVSAFFLHLVRECCLGSLGVCLYLPGGLQVEFATSEISASPAVRHNA
jgi:hypothetical protein